jgi:hypothetical protein
MWLQSFYVNEVFTQKGRMSRTVVLALFNPDEYRDLVWLQSFYQMRCLRRRRSMSRTVVLALFNPDEYRDLVAEILCW